MLVVKSTLVIVTLLGLCEGMIWGSDEGNEDQCAVAIEQTILEDRSTIVNDTSYRLQSTWLSQECEVRAGPEYVIRKYTFFENGTFLLLRHHYAEESCSVAMYTVTARGAIRLLTSSAIVPGATDATYELDRVHIVPLTRQVAQKFSHRVNVTCTPQPKWRPYVPQLVYEQSSSRYSNFLWDGPKYNEFPRHKSTTRKNRGPDCLKPLGIEFGELGLVRVHTKFSNPSSFVVGTKKIPRVELLLGSLPPNVYTKKTHRSTSLQPTILLRSDTIRDCLVCGAISRGTETSPPLLHEVAALPALLGGSWLTYGCESHETGVWTKRRIDVYSGDTLWTGRWDYYADSYCNHFLYGIAAAGSYVQRASRQRRHGETERDVKNFFDRNYDSIDDYNGQIRETRDYRSSERSFRTIRDVDGEDVADDRRSTEMSNDVNWLRTKKKFGAWTTPQLARRLLKIYGSKKQITEAMLTNVDDDGETIETSTEMTVEKLMRDAVLSNGKKRTKTIVVAAPKFDTPRGDVERKLLMGSTKNREGPKIPLTTETVKNRRSLDVEDSYRHLFQHAQPSMAEAFAAMLRGNQRREETTMKPMISTVPSGTTELDLHVAESLLIAGDLSVAARCGAQILGDEREFGGRGLRVRPMTTWPRNCVKWGIEAPSIVGLRARVGVDWNGRYTLLIGKRDDNIWEAALRQCGPTPSHNPDLRAHLRRSVGLRYELYTSAGQSILRDRYSWLVLTASLSVVVAFSLRR